MFTHRWMFQLSDVAYRNLTLFVARLLIRLAILLAFQDLQTRKSMVYLHQRSNYSLSTLAVWWLFFVYSFQLGWPLWVRYPSALLQYVKYLVLYPAAHLTSFCLRSLSISGQSLVLAMEIPAFRSYPSFARCKDTTFLHTKLNKTYVVKHVFNTYKQYRCLINTL